MTFSSLNHICAGNPTGSNESSVGICTTDVGGPLVSNNMLIGIAFYHDPRGCGAILVTIEKMLT